MKSITQVVQNLLKPYIDNHDNAVAGNIAPVETDATSASQSYAVGKQLILAGVLYDVTAAITAGDALVVGTNIAAADDVVTQLASLNGALTNNITDITAEIADMNNILGAKNLLPNMAVSHTEKGVTATVNSDGSITLNGTATGGSAAIHLTGGKFVKGNFDGCILNGCPSGGLVGGYRIQYQSSNDGTTILAQAQDDGNGVVLQTGGTYYLVYIRIAEGSTVNNLTFYPMIRPASIADGTYEPYSMTNQQITPYVQAISNPNLLDNPWFTVNQRGESSYSTVNAYSLDRWRINNNSFVVEKIDEGVKLTHPDNDNLCNLCQYIESYRLGSKIGSPVTLSVLTTDNKIYSASAIIPAFTSTANTIISEMLGDTGFQMVLAVRTSNNYVIIGSTTANATISIKAIKLELGSVSTLAMDTAPNYATELLKCQRYFVNLSKGTYFGYCNTTTHARIFVDLPAKMRAIPTMSYSYTDSQIVIGNTTIAPSSGNGVEVSDGNEVMLIFNITGGTSNALCMFKCNSDDILLSADL